jgi:hypothetical protein
VEHVTQKNIYDPYQIFLTVILLWKSAVSAQDLTEKPQEDVSERRPGKRISSQGLHRRMG